jgi:hypothetical protein
MSCGRYLPSLPAHKGWTAIDVTDLDEPTGECEACGKQEVRYIHLLTHPEHPSISVGCVCAGKLSADYVNPAARERELRNKASRKAREKKKFPGYYGRTWFPHEYQPGAQWTQANYFLVTVKRWRERWLVVFKHLYTGVEKTYLPKGAETLPEAAHRGLSYLETLDWFATK